MRDEFEALKHLESMDKEEVLDLLSHSSEILEKEPSLLIINSEKVAFVGDTHGDLLTSLIAVRRYLKQGWTLIFLGDYVDRGLYQIANIHFLLKQKTIEPEKIFLLRGNHETEEMNLFYGFYQRVRDTYGGNFYTNYADLFYKLPYSVVANRFIGIHGGVARQTKSVKDLEGMKKGKVSKGSIEFELLWNDPNEFISGFQPNDRGPGTFYFGRDVLYEFLENSELKAMIRSHEPRPNGLSVEMDGRLYTVFSCRFYGIEPALIEISGPNLHPVNITG